MSVQLCPSQQRGYDELRRLLPLGNVFALTAGAGLGRTTVLRQLHRDLGGALLGMQHFTDTLRQRNPVALEETFEQLVLDALCEHDAVFVDDLALLSVVTTPMDHLLRRQQRVWAVCATTTSMTMR